MSFVNKPGSALASLIPEWAIDGKKGCKCRDMAAKMDRWGIEGCLLNRQTIINHLVRESSVKLIPILKLAPMALRRAGANRLFDRAINLANEEGHEDSGSHGASP